MISEETKVDDTCTVTVPLQMRQETAAPDEVYDKVYDLDMKFPAAQARQWRKKVILKMIASQVLDTIT